jgi:alkylhydroperoxidase/carboxymuconolactone decarboxylase family protein YurZ
MSDETGPWDTAALSRLEEWDPSWAAACKAVSTNPWRTGVLPLKFVELVRLAINVACTNLNADGTRRHIRRALDAGVTRDEILFVFKCASVMAIHSCSLGAPILLEEAKAAGIAPKPATSVATPAVEKMKAIGQWNAAWDPFFALDPGWTDAFMAASAGIYGSGVMAPKDIELLSIAFDASFTRMYAPGTRRHIQNALKAGASIEEIFEVLKICVAQGVQACIWAFRFSKRNWPLGEARMSAIDREGSMTSEPSNPAANTTLTPASGRQAGSLKAKAAEEFRRFLILFFYLWLLFGVFVLNQGVVLREQGINFTMQGMAVINALVFAKVMMVFEMFDPGGWLRKRPLIYPIFYETLLLSVLILVVHILERLIEGLIHGKTAMESLPSIGGGGLAGLLSASVILFVALLPFFGLRNLGLAMGAGRLRAMLLGTRPGLDEERPNLVADRVGGPHQGQRAKKLDFHSDRLRHHSALPAAPSPWMSLTDRKSRRVGETRKNIAVL